MGKAISVIIPAFNEERYLPLTLEHLRRASDHLRACRDEEVEVIVVDNASTDRTAEIALASGARVIPVPEHNIGRVRNAGASAATGDLLVFLDADTVVPEKLLSRVVEVTADPNCLGGAADTDYRPSRFPIKIYLRMWRMLGQCFGMARGPCSSADATPSPGWVATTSRSTWARTWISTGGWASLPRRGAAPPIFERRASRPLVPAVRSVVNLADPGRDESVLRRALPAPPRRLARLVSRRPPLTVASRLLDRRVRDRLLGLTSRPDPNEWQPPRLRRRGQTETRLSPRLPPDQGASA